MNSLRLKILKRQILTKILTMEISDNVYLIKNLYGINVVKACISCNHKVLDARGKRKCALTEKYVDKYHFCKKWVMLRGLEIAGANM